MEEFLIDLEQLKVEKKKGIVLADSLNKIVDAIIENRKIIIKHEVALKKKKPKKKRSARARNL
ncbi:unnamed protein product [marine sediment metagenome]|uniref:Uncharacterized protein n=1 Tax=marine sediment metagenome TaxID=412755 RepID=X0TRE0_9ZZZZ